MKHLKIFEELFEMHPDNKRFKDQNIKLSRILKEVMDTADEVHEDDGPEWTKKFIVALKKKNFEIFTGKMKDFSPKDFDAIMGPEDYPGDHVGFFMYGKVNAPGGKNVAWDEYYNTYGPEQFGKDSILVARKKEDKK